MPRQIVGNRSRGFCGSEGGDKVLYEYLLRTLADTSIWGNLRTSCRILTLSTRSYCAGVMDMARARLSDRKSGALAVCMWTRLGLMRTGGEALIKAGEP